MGGINIRNAKHSDVPDIARVGEAAFVPESDPIIRNIFPLHLQPTGRRKDGYQSAWRVSRITAALENPGARVIVAEGSDTGEVLGWAQWLVPGREERLMPAYPENIDKEGVKYIHSILNNAAEELFGEQGARDTWDLDFIGVHPAHRRKGIGKMLLAWGMERAAVDKKDCYLVAVPLGRPLYAAAGFEEVASFDIYGERHFQMIIRHDPRWKGS